MTVSFVAAVVLWSALGASVGLILAGLLATVLGWVADFRRPGIRVVSPEVAQRMMAAAREGHKRGRR